MSRLRGPDEGWVESTEGDRDPDLTDEAGSGLDDWRRPFASGGWTRIARIAVACGLVALVIAALARLRA